MRVGILAFQGDFIEHYNVLRALGVEAVLVKEPEELYRLDGLIIPGGESTTISQFLKSTDMGQEIRNRVRDGMAVYGTCAGAILLATEVIPENPPVYNLGLVDMTIRRNAYGRQRESFEADVKLHDSQYHAIFIRAPRIERVGKDVEIIGKLNDEPVLVRQGKVMASTFHPELNFSFPEGQPRRLESLPPDTVHRMFIELMRA